MNLKKIAAEAAVAGMLGVSALGLGAGVANAYPPAPANIPSIPWAQDDGHGGCFWWWCWRPWHGGGDD
jgi:hypothetical protein